MLGNDYSIVDMAVWGWARMVPLVLGDDTQAQLPHLKRLVDEINQRPAVARSAVWREGFKFKTDTDDEARRFLFPRNASLPG